MLRILRFVHLARVPLITLAILGLIGPIGYHEVPGIFLGILDVDSNWNAFLWVCIAIFFVQASAVTTLNLIILYGPARFIDLRLRKRNADERAELQFWILLLSTISSVLLLAYLLWINTSAALPLFWEVIAIVLALVLTLLFVIFAQFLKGRFTVPGLSTGGSASLVLPMPIDLRAGAPEPKGLAREVKAAYEYPDMDLINKFGKVTGKIEQFFVRMLEPFGQGYFIKDPKDNSLHFRGGHIQAVAFLTITLMLYFAVGLSERMVLTRDHPSDLLRFMAAVPPLAYLLFVTMLGCWFFGGLAFFFDRYRVPVLTVFLLACLLTNSAPESDHFFRVRAGSPPYPGERPAAILARHTDTPVLIAAEGGGIQAAAWTAEVIARLHRELARDSIDFRTHIALISGVSGGAVGAMHVGARFNDLQAAPSEAAMSSLQEAAWGWLNSDLLRSTVPWFGSRQIDRGWALERSWEQRLDIQDQYVSDWALMTSRGLPAFNFNTTWVETGQPLVISTSNFPTTANLGLTAFNDLWKDFDVRVSTAVRLSASFPFVSPASRPDGYAVSYGDRHLVDGGYYDNFGLYSLIAWLDDALHEPSYNGSRTILVLQIRSFPNAGQDVSTIGREQQGWFAQTYAPLDAMLNVRRAGQLRQAESLMKYFKNSEGGSALVFPVDLVYENNKKGCPDPPLSWKLTTVQKGCVEAARIRNEQIKMKCIRKFLSGDRTPDAEYPDKCWTI